MTADSNLVIEERRGNAVLLTLNRPERHHALNQALSDALAGAITRASNDDSVACLVITGSGEKAFCAGADMVEMSGAGGEGSTASGASRLYAAIDSAPMPVIAAINGYCFGGGARLAIGCDIRLAAEQASFRLPGSEYGLVVAAATLPRLVGAERAKDLIFTARRFTAAEAFSYGLLSAVYSQAELLPAAWAMAETIASHSPGAVRAAKQVIDAATLSDEARQLEDEANRRLRGSDEQVARFRDATRRVTGR